MRDALIDALVVARTRRPSHEARGETYEIDLDTGRALRVETGRPLPEGRYYAVGGRCAEDGLTAYLPLDMLAEDPPDMENAEIALMTLVERIDAELGAFEAASGSSVLFDALETVSYTPDPADLRIVPGEDLPDFAMRMAPALRERLEEGLAGAIHRPENRVGGVFGYTTLLGILDTGERTLAPDTLIELDRVPGAPAVMVEDAVVIALEPGAGGAGFTVGAVGPITGFLRDRGVRGDDVLLIGPRGHLDAALVEDMEPGSEWTHPVEGGPVDLYRGGIRVARARVLVAGTHACLKIV